MAKKNITPEMKLKIALEVLKEERHIGDIASEYGIHSSTVNRWVQELLSGATESTQAPKRTNRPQRKKRTRTSK